MMKIAEELGKESKCMGLITGESIGQVASQLCTAFTVLMKCVQCLYTDQLSALISRRLLTYQKR